MILPMLLLALVGTLADQGRATPPRPAAPRPAPARPTAPTPPPKDPFFVSTLSATEITGKQAVLETPMGTIVMDLLADAAPTHVAHFITRAREGAYDGTTFHRVIAMGIIQGGDPNSKDPAQAAKYGTGGLGVLRFEENAEKHTKGSVSAVLVPGRRDSGGSQFFITVSDQPTLDGQYTVF
jgi:peptidyl-prolyl cis-trans isomerase B (cyclophilin B)